MILTLDITCVGGAYLKDTASKRCEVPANLLMLDLADFILTSFEFDNDHLHEFYVALSPRGYPKTSVADSQEIGQVLPLPVTAHLMFWFDFGDDWQFMITEVGRQRVALLPENLPRVISEQGHNPIQYPLVEDDT